MLIKYGALLCLFSFLFAEEKYNLSQDKERLKQVSQDLNTIIIKNKKIKIDSSKHIDIYKATSSNWRAIYEMHHKGVQLSIDSYHGSLEDNSEARDLNQKQSKLIDLLDKTFYDITAKRFGIIRGLFEQNKAFKVLFEDNTLKDIYLEIKSVPLRWITLLNLRYNQIRNDLLSGIDGWLSILKQLWHIVLILLFGLILKRVFQSYNDYLKKVRFDHIRQSYRSKKSLFMAKWMGRFIPLLPWLFFLSFLNIAKYLVQHGYLKEIIILIPYFSYYSVYRIFRLVVKQLIASSSYYDDKSFHLDRIKLDWTSRFLGSVFLTGLILLHSFGSAGGKGLLYLWIESFFQYLFVFILFYVAYRWHKEIREIAKRIFTGKAAVIIDSLFNGVGKIIFSLPIFLIEMVYHFLFWIYSLLERFDIVRAISAQYFRKKVEASGEKDNVLKNIKDLPQEYLELFYSEESNTILEQKSQHLIMKSIEEHVDAWKADLSDEHISLISGEKGSGKTFLLKCLEEKLKSNDVRILSFTLQDRFSQKEQLNEIMSEIKNDEGKTIVLIDGLQFLFLSKRKGFEYFKNFLKLTQKEEYQDIFWCLGINNYSWEFLEAVLKKSRYFNFIYKLERWREEDIQKLILSNHQKTGFDLDYDQVLISPNRSSDEVNEVDAEARYFRILWEEAMGNPSVAIKVWLSSLERNGQKSMRALIPVERSDDLGSLPDAFHFVLATIVRHESMTIEEIIQSTDLSNDIVRNAVKSCLEKEYLVRKRGKKVGISILAQHEVYSSLRRMNFIYG